MLNCLVLISSCLIIFVIKRNIVMAMDGGEEEDALACPTRGTDVDAAAQAEQDVARRRCKGKVTADASSSCAAGVSCSGAIARGTTDSSAGVEVAAKDGKSANCCVNPLNLVAY